MYTLHAALSPVWFLHITRQDVLFGVTRLIPDSQVHQLTLLNEHITFVVMGGSCFETVDTCFS